jgi:glutaryl-CoA dehydrogenase
MASVAETDFYLRDELLTDEERAVHQAVGCFVNTEVLPSVGLCFREGRFPREWIPKLAELGVLGANLQGYGCAGMSGVGYGVACEQLERGDSGLRSFVSVQSSLSMYPIATYGSDAQKQRFLPAMAKGECIGCFGLTEPESGSNPGEMRTRAKRDGQDYVLTGQKAWISNGNLAHLALVWAKVDDGGPESIRGFLVERGMKGFSSRPVEGKHSLRISDTADLHFDEVRIPAENVLPHVQGLKGPLSCLSQARFGIAFGVMGAAIACFESARDYALGRSQFGKPIASFQLTQEKLADMLEDIVKGQLLAMRLGRLKDAGKATPERVSLAKRSNVRAALSLARSARSVLGANGITDAYPPVRHMLNLESVYTYEGTHEMHTLILGKAITGIDAFSG